MENARQNGVRRLAGLSAARADILGVTHLLMLAKASAKLHGGDQVCIRLLEKCIAHLLQQNEISRADVSGCFGPTEFVPYPAVLHVLTYAQAEATDSLGDTHCADLLGECIGRLARSHRFARAPADARTLPIN
jgi:hypothetical protein